MDTPIVKVGSLLPFVKPSAKPSQNDYEGDELGKNEGHHVNQRDELGLG